MQIQNILLRTFIEIESKQKWEQVKISRQIKTFVNLGKWLILNSSKAGQFCTASFYALTSHDRQLILI